MIEIGVFIAIIIIIIYTWLTWNHNYWKKLDVPYLEPSLIFGNIKDFILMRKCKGHVYHELYRQSSEPAVGIFTMRQPQLLIRDPGFVKVLTINEFNNFGENDFYTEPNDFFLTTNIFFYSGEKWKKNRNIITPALSMAKLKQFMPHMVSVAKEMVTYLDENKGQAFEAKYFSGLFTTDTAMSFVYGIKTDSFKDPNTIYRKKFYEIFHPTWSIGLLFLIASSFPSLGHFFKIGFTPKSFVTFFTSLVKETVEYRKKNQVTRKDFLQYLMDSSGKNGNPEFSIYDMAGLSMNIIADGTETTSAVLSLIMDAVVRYPEEQKKLRDEIDSIIQSDDDITYENINSLPYLQAFIHESMRILTPIPLLEKKCTNNCEVVYKGKQYKFRKGDRIAFPLHSIHNNSEYFANPETFNPSRFLETDESSSFSPFGNGPRSCIGRIVSIILMKFFLISLLKNFEILPKDGAAKDIEFDPNSTAFLLIKGGVWFRVKRR